MSAPDVLDLYWAANRGADVPAGVTVATRSAPFGKATRRGDRLIHRPEKVFVVWAYPSRPRFAARWLCRNWSEKCVLLNEPTGGTVCLRCSVAEAAEHLGAKRGNRAVYYAQLNGAIKIGISNQVGLRVAALKAELLAAEPARLPYGTADERRRHAQFAHLRLDGEWFKPGPDLMAHIDSLRAKAAA